jgi:hypothetical protein
MAHCRAALHLSKCHRSIVAPLPRFEQWGHVRHICEGCRPSAMSFLILARPKDPLMKG